MHNLLIPKYRYFNLRMLSIYSNAKRKVAENHYNNKLEKFIGTYYVRGCQS